MKKIYNGNDIFAPFNAGLYGYGDYDTDRSFQFDESKTEILAAFRGEYEEAIRDALASAGIEYKGLSYYSPKYYNFSTDSIDLALELVDVEKYHAALEPHRALVQKLLDENESYDGYMALTSDHFEEARDNFEPPCIQALLSGIDFENFDINEHIAYAYPCESCELIHEDIEYMDDKETATVKKCEAAT